MTHFDEEAALDLLERGIRLAQDNPGEVVRVEFTKLNACVDLSVDWEDRRDPTFLASLALSAVEDLKRHARGLEPRFGTSVHPLCSLVLRGYTARLTPSRREIFPNFSRRGSPPRLSLSLD